MKTTGQILKSKREEMNISLQEVSLATKINAKILKSIEDGDMDSLPPKTFVRGFVKAYASYLKLNTENILQSFSEEMGTTKPASKILDPKAGISPAAPSPEEHVEREQKQVLKKNIVVIAILLAAIVIVLVVKRKMDRYQDETVIKTLPSDITAPAIATDSPPAATPPAVEAATPGPLPETAPTPSPAVVEAPAKAAAPAAPAAPAPPPPAAVESPAKVAAPTKPATPPPPAPPVVENNAAAAKPATPPEAAPPKMQEAIIEALDQVDVTISVDGDAEKSIRLAAEQVHAIKMRKKLILKISNGGAVNIVVNGRDRGIAGDLGKPARIELP